MKSMKILVLILSMILPGCANANISYQNAQNTSNFPNAFISTTDLISTCYIYTPFPEYQDVLNPFLQQEQSIGAISRYNYNNLTSPYIIGNPPTNRVDWMKWHVMNVKLGKYLER